MEPFVVVGKDAYGVLAYRLKCRKAKEEGLIIEDGISYKVSTQGKCVHYPRCENEYENMLAQMVGL